MVPKISSSPPHLTHLARLVERRIRDPKVLLLGSNPGWSVTFSLICHLLIMWLIDVIMLIQHAYMIVAMVGNLEPCSREIFQFGWNKIEKLHQKYWVTALFFVYEGNLYYEGGNFSTFPVLVLQHVYGTSLNVRFVNTNLYRIIHSGRVSILKFDIFMMMVLKI